MTPVRGRMLAGVAVLAAAAAGFVAGRATSVPPPADPARAELAAVCARASRAFSAAPPAGIVTVLALSCIPSRTDRATRNAAADAWGAAADRCAADARACAELSALAGRYAEQLSRGR